ncbi:MAG: bacterioferritin [Thermoanaerobaculia bacterium]
MAVKAGAEIIAALNEILTGELTAVNQYFLHARMLKNWGLNRLAERVYHESIDEMRHADWLIERILYLDGVPNVQRLGRIRIGETVPEMFASDLAVEQEAIPRLNATIAQCVAAGDNGTRELLAKILVSEEEHLDWLETQVGLVDRLTLPVYLAQHI